VVITDTLPGTLNPASIQMGAGSHPFTWELKGPGILEFTFANILLPDSNVNEPLSHGFVGFRIQPHEQLMVGEQISNIANIYFDFNPPVITEPSVLVAEFWTGIRPLNGAMDMNIFPNPVDQVLSITMSNAASPYALEVLTLDGRLVAAHRPSGPSFNLNVGDLASGSYCIRVIEADGGELRGRFFKQ
jgi:hypothetical protein